MVKIAARALRIGVHLRFDPKFTLEFEHLPKIFSAGLLSSLGMGPLPLSRYNGLHDLDSYVTSGTKIILRHRQVRCAWCGGLRELLRKPTKAFTRRLSKTHFFTPILDW